MTSPNDLQGQLDALLQRLTALEVSQLHRQADTDTAQTAIHHTLGISPQQGSPGDHNHDGRNSKLLSAFSDYVNKHGDTITGDLIFGSPEVARIDTTGKFTGGWSPNIEGFHELYHPTSGGRFGLRFNSRVNPSSDSGYILFQDNSSAVEGWVAGDIENARFIIGVTNDASQNTVSDELWFQGAGRVVTNVGTVDSDLAAIISGAYAHQPHPGGFYKVQDWRANNTTVAYLQANGWWYGYSYQTISAKATKDNIQTLNVESVLEGFKKLRPVSYKSKNKNAGPETLYSLVAEEVLSDLPHVARSGDSSARSDASIDITALLITTVGVCQNLLRRIELLENK